MQSEINRKLLLALYFPLNSIQTQQTISDAHCLAPFPNPPTLSGPYSLLSGVGLIRSVRQALVCVGGWFRSPTSLCQVNFGMFDMILKRKWIRNCFPRTLVVHYSALSNILPVNMLFSCAEQIPEELSQAPWPSVYEQKQRSRSHQRNIHPSMVVFCGISPPESLMLVVVVLLLLHSFHVLGENTP